MGRGLHIGAGAAGAREFRAVAHPGSATSATASAALPPR